MKLKSLLIGSAAAMFGFTGVNAADAVVAEPEPMEYVKVCDTYGAGWHYIPGTETCLKFSGYVRTQYDYRDNTGTASQGLYWTGRARFNIDAREETDYGTLRAFIRIQGDINGDLTGRRGPSTVPDDAYQGDPRAYIDQAYIQLGGWLFGYGDSMWVRNTYGGYVMDGFEGYYGYNQANMISYTHSANGFTAALSLERGYSQDDLAPNVIAHLQYTGSWGYIFATGVYDFDSTAVGTSDDGWAIKVGLQLNLDSLSPGDLLRIQGTFGEHGPDRGIYLEAGTDWEAFVSYRHVFNSEWSAALTYSTFDDFDNFFVAGQLQWTPVKNFTVQAALAYYNGSSAQAEDWRFRARIIRSF